MHVRPIRFAYVNCNGIEFVPEFLQEKCITLFGDTFLYAIK